MADACTLESRESLRLAALARYRVLDTPRESGFDELAELASEICGTPIAVVNLIDSSRQWFKAEVGLGVDSTPLDTSFCRTAILEEDFLLVPDATQDERFFCNPLVTAEGGLRFYAGALLKSPDGLPIGTLCVLDYEPRSLDASQQRALRTLARQVMAQLELRIAVIERDEINIALRESGGRFRAAIDAVQGVLWTNTPAGEMHGEQPGWAALTGQTQAEYQGYGWASAVHPEDAQPTVDAWNAAVAAKRVFVFEHRVRCRDGAWRRFSVRAIPMFDAAGEIREWVGVHTDVTEQRAAQDQLRDLNNQLESRVADRTAERDRMWRLSTDLMLVAGFDGTINSVNPAWKSMLGWNADELIGNNFLALVDPDDQAATIAEMSKLDQGRTTFRFENRYQASDGRYHWIAWTAVPEAQLIHAVGRDVTAEREAAAELEAAEEALRQSQKMEAMGQLTGGVAHDFNNLLTPIVGSLDMLQRNRVGGEREQRLIEGALQSAERAKTLVQRLLAFARRQPLQSSAVDIGKVVDGMADLLSSTTGPQVRVVVDVEQDLPPAEADPNQLEMALLNLGVNARDAMPDGGTLRISAVRESLRHTKGELKPGDYVRLSVADTGIGMDQATLARAAEPFFSTKGVGKGTGLGLSMAHGLAAQLGGALKIKSRVGLGTNVELWLPLSAGPLNSEEPRADAIALEAHRGLVLLVDDEDVVRASTADMLSELGYSVEEAPSAEAALALLNNGIKPNLLVTDHLMPGMTGLELVWAIREHCPQLPALIVSGYAEAEGLAPDMPRLTKPFRRSELAEKLGELRTKTLY